MAVSISRRPDFSIEGETSHFIAVKAYYPVLFIFDTTNPGGYTDYKLKIDVYDSSNNLIAETEYKPFSDGKVYFDVVGWIKDRVSNKLDTTFPVTNVADANNTFGFYIKYREYYNGLDQAAITDSAVYFAVASAKQLQDEFGESLVAYTAFNVDLTRKAKFLSVLEKPRYWAGYPFKLYFAFEDNGAAPDVTREEEKFDHNGVSLSTSSTLLTSSDFEKVNSLGIASGYGSSVEEIDVWLDSDLSAGGCGVLDANDWAYDPWFLSGSQLVGIRVSLNIPTTDIDTFDQTSVLSAELYNPLGVLSDNLTYNVGNDWWETVGPPPDIVGGTWEARILGIAVTTKGGAPCTHDFIDTQTGSNAAPTAGAIFISSPGMVGSNRAHAGDVLTANYTYSDLDGDPEGGTVIEWYSYDDADGSVNETLVYTGSELDKTYTIPGGTTKKSYRFDVTPASPSGVSPGATVTSGAVFVVQEAFSGSTTKLNPSITIAGSEGYIDWGDSNIDTYDYSAGAGALSHTYAGAGTYNFTAYCFDPDNITSFNISNQGLTGTLDTAKLTGLTSTYNISLNTSLTAVNTPTACPGSVSLIDFSFCETLGSIDLSNFTGAQGTILGNNCYLITSIDFPVTSGVVNSLAISRCYALSGRVDFSVMSNLGGVVNATRCTVVTGFDFPVASPTLYTLLTVSRCNITGQLDISNCNLGTTFQANNNPLLTEILHPTNSNTIATYDCSLCGINTHLNLSTLSGLSGSVKFNSNLIPQVTFPTNSNTFTSIWGFGNNLSAVDFSPLTGLSGGIDFQSNSITTITNPASSGLITGYNFQNNSISGTVDCSNINLSGVIVFDNNGSMTGWTVNSSNSGVPNNIQLDGTNITGILDLTG